MALSTYFCLVTPAKAGVQRPYFQLKELDSRLCGNDEISRIGGQS